MDEIIFETIIGRLTDSGGQMSVDRLRRLVDGGNISTLPYSFDTILEMAIDSGRVKIKDGIVFLLFKDKTQVGNSQTTNILADKMVYNTGQINAPISQDELYFSSKDNITQDVKREAKIPQTIAKHIIIPLVVGVAVGLIVWYLTTQT